jgi:hypothetical protein
MSRRTGDSFHIYGDGNQDNELGVALPGSTSTLYSNPIKMGRSGGRFSIQLIWTAGPTGAFTLQYSLKQDPNLATDADWVTDTTVTVLGTSLTVAGGTGNSIIFAGNALPEWVRVKWVATSGSASTVNGLAKVECQV